MLDGNAYKAHFPHDPAYEQAEDSSPRPPNYAALLDALAALEEEFRSILAASSAAND
jgi:hypothetical protein